MSLRFAAIGVLLLSAAVAAQSPPAEPATPAGIIRGVVTAGDTARPLRGADVRIQGGSIPLFQPRWVRTNEQGRYEVTGLQAGRYTVTVSKVGYLTLEYGQRRPNESGRPAEVSESTPLENIDIVLPRGGVIVARITDRFGDPLRGVSVRAYQYRFGLGERRLQQVSSGFSITDDRGEQRIPGLPPGEYFVVASPALSLASVRGDAETYHPGAVRVQDALPVRLDIGEEAYVTFTMASARRARVSGVILGSSGGPLASPMASLNLTYLGSAMLPRLNVAPDGSFREENLAPGEYVIEVRSPEWAMHPLRVFGEDVDNLVITTKKPGAVRARITFDGAQPPAESVEIRPAFPGPRCGYPPSPCGGGPVGLIPTVTPDDWTFNAQLAGVGVLRLQRPATWSLKTVLLEGRDVTDTPLDFGAAYAGKSIEIVLTQRRGEVSGTVTDDRGQLTRDYVAVVFPEDDAQWTLFSRFIAVGRPDQEGRFKLTGLPPGRYLAAALVYLEPGGERNPETLELLRRSATSFSLSEGESRSLNLKVSP